MCICVTVWVYMHSYIFTQYIYMHTSHIYVYIYISKIIKEKRLFIEKVVIKRVTGKVAKRAWKEEGVGEVIKFYLI